jgi:hypothetical protein
MSTSIFRPKINITYPADNHTIFEEYFFLKFDDKCIDAERIYIPVFWTSLYVNRDFGRGNIADLQEYLDTLDRSKKYFTIVQYDDNILNDLKDLDILVFAQGGHGRYRDRCYPIPLNCLPSQHSTTTCQKDIFCSFVGAIEGRHRIREKMRDSLYGKEKYLISESLGSRSFHDIMNRSSFSLCPRGYGKTSFRICEALQRGSVPIYVYDDPLVPFFDITNFEDYGVLVHENEIDKIDDILSAITPEKYANMVEIGSKAYCDFYTYDGCFQRIIEKMKIS